MKNLENLLSIFSLNIQVDVQDVDSPDIDGQLLMANFWQFIVDLQLLMVKYVHGSTDLYHQELAVQILMVRMSIIYYDQVLTNLIRYV